MANEVVGSDKFIRDILVNSAALAIEMPHLSDGSAKVYKDFAPEGVAEPYVVFSFHAGEDLEAVGTGRRRLFTRPLYLVKAVGKDYIKVAKLSSIIDAALEGIPQGAPTAIAAIDGVTYQVSGCYREQPVHYAEVDNNARYEHMGGLYRIFVS